MADVAEIVSYVVAGVLALLLVLTTHRFPRSRGRNILWHLLFGGCVAIIYLFVPSTAMLNIFSPLTAVIIGTVFPIYESIRAVCTPGGEDDKSWLQYWVAAGVLTYSMQWFDPIAENHDSFRLHFYFAAMCFYLWLMLPQTDGCALLFDFLTRPLIAPLVKPIAKRFDNLLQGIVNAFISAAHLWFIWFAFMFLPASLREFITVSVGTIYPLCASIVAVTTEDYDDDTFWLTYWSCYGCLYLIMVTLGNYIGKIPGFYTIFLFTSVYLMLPMFSGAEQVFRKILVPLAGLREMLLMRDALAMKNEMLASLPPDRAKEMKKVIAASFAMDDDNDNKDGTNNGNGEQDPLITASFYGSILSKRNSSLTAAAAGTGAAAGGAGSGGVGIV